MRTFIQRLLVVFTLAACAGKSEAQTYTFGSEVQSTTTANITYTSSTGAFAYTDADNSSSDQASLPLTGAAAELITSTNSWHASLTVDVAARSMTATKKLSPQAGIGLSAVHLAGVTEYYVSIIGGQINNTGNANPDFPTNIYGTGAQFFAYIGSANEPTTPLGSSLYEDGYSLLPLSGGTNSSAAAENIEANTGVMTLSYNSATKTLTGYCGEVPVGSYSIAAWGTNPSLALYASGGSGEGVGVAAGTDTATNFNVCTGTFTLPQLARVFARTNLVLSWPTNATGFILESSTNLSSSATWTPVSKAPAVVKGNYTVTNSATGTRQFFRLIQR